MRYSLIMRTFGDLSLAFKDNKIQFNYRRPPLRDFRDLGFAFKDNDI